jgi:phosphoglycolate phosphatase
MTRHVVWDWNGTLLDDVDHSVTALNRLLTERSLPCLDRHAYRERFGFPVKSFYVELGFDADREDFAALSATFIGHYRVAAQTASPHAEVRHVMSQLAARGIAQSVLSAMEISLLRQMLAEHDLLEHLLHVRGLSDLQATSKVALGVELMRSLRAQPDEVLFVGDTLHDLETARAMGAQCLLFTRGHQTAERLSHSGATLIDSLHQVLDYAQGAAADGLR